ncbi:MAG: Eco57I restriction-modification methylase domain-containing protein [Candidatus Bathyarchaeales archaeon]
MLREQAEEKVRQLVESYDSIVRLDRKAEYSEADVGSKFILPLLSALGWDVTKIEDVKEQRRTLTGVADYSLFNVGGTAKIFLELKKFTEDLDGYRRVGGKDKSFPQIAIDYAWQSRADWAVLTNFEEIRLYYSRVRKPEEGLIFKLKYHQYLESFDKLWLISKESVVSGLLDTYEKRRLRRDVDEELLKDLVYCRKLLVSNIRRNNPQLSKEEINDATQRILDRLMFIRSCEDRLIIPAESLWTQFSVWQKIAIDKSVRTFMMDLKNIFRDFDAVYNGQLFAPHFCEDLRIDNEVLESVLILLYNYNFDLIPVSVLGNAYELYIGTIIREKEGTLKEDELALVEEPTVRKEHGIYYTPEHIVDYIIRNTLGKLLANCKTPEDVSKIKVLDPACGSGSFLIKAFDVIKEWYDRYNKQRQLEATPNTLDVHLPLVQNVEERILTENLYGVDLDPQAVEITILSLSLKAVQTRKKLPYIGDHIKCGNSIISGSTEKMVDYFGEKWQEKKPFNWKEEFPEVFEQGGFSVVIGNPPYYSMETRTTEEQNYFKSTRPDLYRGKNDVYYYFIVLGLDLLKDGGILGFIVERYWLEATYGDKLREFILNNACVEEIIDFGKLQIFRDSGNHTCICIFKKNLDVEERLNNTLRVARVIDWNRSHEGLLNYIKLHREDKEFEDQFIQIFSLKQEDLSSKPWVLATSKLQNILSKISRNCWILSDICEIEQGQKSGLNEVFSVTGAQIREYNLEMQLLKKND